MNDQLEQTILEMVRTYLRSLSDSDFLALTLTEQRRMYLYLLYKKWRGEPFYGTPYEIVKNCHPYPTNWNGRQMINRLMKENKMVKAYYDGMYGTYTVEEARVWGMTDVKPLNF